MKSYIKQLSLTKKNKEKFNKDITDKGGVSIDLPLEKGTGSNSFIQKGSNCSARGNRSFAHGNSTVAIGTASHSEGSYTQAIGEYSHAEGSNTIANGDRSHVEGDGTETKNITEHAEGSFNVSNYGSTNSRRTRHSIGVGTSDSDRKNAIEVMANGDAYLLNVNGYDGTNPDAQRTLQALLNSLKLNIQASQNTTITTTKSGNVSVPKLTVDQVTKAYNQIVSGGTCTITDATGNYHLVVNQADSLNGSPAIGILYYNTIALTYEVEGNNVTIHFTEL